MRSFIFIILQIWITRSSKNYDWSWTMIHGPETLKRLKTFCLSRFCNLIFRKVLYFFISREMFNFLHFLGKIELVSKNSVLLSRQRKKKSFSERISRCGVNFSREKTRKKTVFEAEQQGPDCRSSVVRQWCVVRWIGVGSVSAVTTLYNSPNSLNQFWKTRYSGRSLVVPIAYSKAKAQGRWSKNLFFCYLISHIG